MIMSEQHISVAANLPAGYLNYQQGLNKVIVKTGWCTGITHFGRVTFIVMIYAIVKYQTISQKINCIIMILCV